MNAIVCNYVPHVKDIPPRRRITLTQSSNKQTALKKTAHYNHQLRQRIATETV